MNINRRHDCLYLDGSVQELCAYFEARGCEVRRPRFPKPMRDAYGLVVLRDGHTVGMITCYMRGGGAECQCRDREPEHDPGDEDVVR